MESPDLSELLPLLKDHRQKHLVLVAGYFLQKVKGQNHFSTREIKSELVGQVSGASKINVGAVILNHCVGSIQPLKEKSPEGSKLWKLNNTGIEAVAGLLASKKTLAGAKKISPFRSTISIPLFMALLPSCFVTAI